MSRKPAPTPIVRDHFPETPTPEGRAAVQHALSILRSTNPSNTSGKTG